MSRADVAVVGLGIVGACAVHALARAGARVVALDAGGAGAGTSGSSFAWVNAVHKEPEAYHRLNADGIVAHRDLARELGGEAGYHAGGSLEWAGSDEDERALRSLVERLAGRGYPAQWIPAHRARTMEPALSIPGPVREVAHYTVDGWVDAPRLIAQLLAAARARGAEVRERTPVRSLRVHGARVEALALEGEDLVADSVLVCVGPATRAFLAPLDVELPVDRVPGLLAVTSPLAEPLRRVVHAPGVHVRPDPGGGLMIGTVDLDRRVTEATTPAAAADVAALLLERAAHVVPAARDATIVASRIGVRPMPADRHTIAGRIPGLANGWVLATHSGITLGPLLGRLIAPEILRDSASPALAPFRPTRFAPSAPSRS